jgi:cephalosporin hydroxylase
MNLNDPKNHVKISAMASDSELQKLSRAWFDRSCEFGYSYNFTWLGRPIIQFPQDIVALQELIWAVKPQLIIETGIAHGGSLILSSSMLELIGGNGRVLGVDVEIRPHNRKAIEAHPMAKRITLMEGSAVDDGIAAQVRSLAEGKSPVLVILDSNHTHDHVLQELNLYSPLVTKGSYLLVFDTVIEDMPSGAFPNRPWGRGNNPKTAVKEFLKHNHRFVLESEIENKLLLTVAPGGYLKCIAD